MGTKVEWFNGSNLKTYWGGIASSAEVFTEDRKKMVGHLTEDWGVIREGYVDYALGMIKGIKGEYVFNSTAFEWFVESLGHQGIEEITEKEWLKRYANRDA